MPHYQWTAAALRVMRATSRGEFAAAEAALQEARRLADRAQDSNATVTLLVQQLALAEMTDDRPKIEALCARLERQVAGLPHSGMYVKPTLLAITACTLGRRPDPADMDEAYLRSIVLFSDMGALASLGEYLAAYGSRPFAQFAYDRILKFQHRCGHWGLLGLRWMGPVARSLGHLAITLGMPEAANEHFAAAVETARRMNARPWMARITLEWVESLQRAGQRPQRARLLLEEARAIAAELGLASLEARLAKLCESGESHAAVDTAAPAPAAAAGPPAVSHFRLVCEGDVWRCECEGREFRVRDSRGMQMLARLVAAPAQEIHVLDLMGAAAGDQPMDTGDSGEMLDDRARREYRRRLESLRAELEEAESRQDVAGAEAAREELEQLSAELSRAYGLGGRARRAGSNVERARVNVQRRLKHAVERIAAECPAAGRYLEWALRTGSFCSYRPD
jgi:hypothetical protein